MTSKSSHSALILLTCASNDLGLSRKKKGDKLCRLPPSKVPECHHHQKAQFLKHLLLYYLYLIFLLWFQVDGEIDMQHEYFYRLFGFILLVSSLFGVLTQNSSDPTVKITFLWSRVIVSYICVYTGTVFRMC